MIRRLLLVCVTLASSQQECTGSDTCAVKSPERNHLLLQTHSLSRKLEADLTANATDILSMGRRKKKSKAKKDRKRSGKKDRKRKGTPKKDRKRKGKADKKKDRKLLKDAGGVGNAWNGFIVGVPVTIQDEDGNYLIGGDYSEDGVSIIATVANMEDAGCAIWSTSFGRGAGLTAKTKGFTDTLAGIQIFNNAERLHKEATAPQDDHWLDNKGRWYISACGDSMTQWGNTAANVRYADGTLTQEGCTKKLTITVQSFGTGGDECVVDGEAGGDADGVGKGPGCMSVDGAAVIEGVPVCDVVPALENGAAICSCGGVVGGGALADKKRGGKGKKDRKRGGGKKDRKRGGKKDRKKKVLLQADQQRRKRKGKKDRKRGGKGKKDRKRGGKGKKDRKRGKGKKDRKRKGVKKDAAGAVTAGPVFHLIPEGTTCDDFCAEEGLTCDAVALSAASDDCENAEEHAEEHDAEEHADDTAVEPADETGGEPADETGDESADETAGEDEEPADETAGELEEPADESGEEPAEESGEEPAEESGEEPAEESDEGAETDESGAEEGSDETGEETGEGSDTSSSDTSDSSSGSDSAST